jgi:superfamily I DNA/RNA helicase
MRLEKWFISNLDDSQRKIIVSDPNENLIVQGAAGSGKTNLAIHRAMQASAFGSYAIIIYTIALKRMVAYGMDTLGLDKERIAYDWAWRHRGFDFDGFVYWRRDDRFNLYLAQDTNIRKFEATNQAYTESKEQYPTSLLVSIDFADWVDDRFYCAFGRRVRWFREVLMTEVFDINDEQFELIPSGTLFKKAEDTIDYIIVDEAQDFDIDDYNNRFIPHANRSITLFGDSAQKIYSNRGATMDAITETLQYERFSLRYNYRLPKSIAKVAQDILSPPVDLLTDNMKDGGNSDYPDYPKAVISKYNSKEDELRGILNRIQIEDLDDVAILVPHEENVKEVNDFLVKAGIKTQVHYRTGKIIPYRTINTLDFSNNDLPCILTYHAAKGTEFDNVFVPFANNNAKLPDRNAFYVACTRSSRALYISYSEIKSPYLSRIKSDFVIEQDIPPLGQEEIIIENSFEVVVDRYAETCIQDVAGFSDNDIDDIYDWNNDYGTHYGKYAGTYAQDEAGLSDDEIDDIFDGEPDAYWNID